MSALLCTSPVIKLHRLSAEPVLKPRPEHEWERGACLNSAVLHNSSGWFLLYRAINHEPGWKPGRGSGPYNSSVGLAWSGDGLHFERLPQPVIPFGFYGPGMEAQDCRIVELDGHYILTYCLYDKIKGIPRPGYSVSENLRTWQHCGELVPFSEFGFNKNATLFPEKIGGKYALFHRPESSEYLREPASQFNWRTWSRGPLTEETAPGITLSYGTKIGVWEDSEVVMKPRPGLWDGVKIGPGAPPLRTPHGWLNVYHGVDEKHIYRLGLALHDINDPSVILHRQEEPLLEPELDWELKGDVDGAIFTCGAALIGDRLRVYYAGADSVIGVAEATIAPLLTM
jgi:beta-1,2-mannobiose phosphorylase / 1,2-beta-oligomannan phosphorylase